MKKGRPKNRINRICQNCSRTFEVAVSVIKYSACKYCSRYCYSQGKKVTREHYLERIKRKQAKRRKERPEYVNFLNRQRMIREKGAIGKHTLQEWQALKIKYNFTCPSCLKEEPNIILTQDHIIPLIMGGNNYIENIQPLCRSCNSTKHSKTIRFPFVYL